MIEGIELVPVGNTDISVYMENVRINSQRDLPWYDFSPPHERQVSIVGGSPSVEKAAGELLWRKSLGQEVWALNGAYKWLLDIGLQPDAHILIDARPFNKKFIIPGDCKYYLSSQCHPSLFDMLIGYDVTVMHCLTDGMEDYLKNLDTDKPTHLLGGGTTVGMKAFLMAYQSGFRKIHLYGMDSCYTGDSHHAYEQTENNGERKLRVMCGDKEFTCAPWMLTQLEDFKGLLDYVEGTITINGDGILAEYVRSL